MSCVCLDVYIHTTRNIYRYIFQYLLFKCQPYVKKLVTRQFACSSTGICTLLASHFFLNHYRKQSLIHKTCFHTLRLFATYPNLPSPKICDTQNLVWSLQCTQKALYIIWHCSVTDASSKMLGVWCPSIELYCFRDSMTLISFTYHIMVVSHTYFGAS